MQLSKDYTLEDFTYSQTAIKKGIDNTPAPEHIENIVALVERVTQPVANYLKQPLRISSGYRSPKLNEIIGGAVKVVSGKKIPVSQHCRGEANDLVCKGRNAEVFRYIKNNLEFDQLIWEFGSDSEPAWVHVSYSLKKNRKQVLKTQIVYGKTKFVPYK